MIIAGISIGAPIQLEDKSHRPGEGFGLQMLYERPDEKGFDRLSMPELGSKLANALWSIGDGGEIKQELGEPQRSTEQINDTAEEFLKVANMTPAERIRYFYLDSQELDEDKLAAMSQEDQEVIEQQIRQLILEQLGLENEDGKAGNYEITAAPGSDSVVIYLEPTG
jgi:hypothetical protein